MINKGRKFFGILLIIIIIVAVALIGYLAYDYISKHLIAKEAAKIENIITVEVSEQNEIANEVITNTNTSVNTTVNSNSSNKQTSSVKYRGYNVIGTIQIPKTKVK